LYSSSTHSSSGIFRRRYLGICLALLGWLIHSAISLHRYPAPYAGVDFRAVYASSRCEIAGCDPFSESETMAEFLRQGGTLAEAGPPPTYGPFLPNMAGYPPTTLLYVLPITALRWPLALHVWLAFSIAIYGFAVILFADMCADYSPLAANLCLGFFLLWGAVALVVANPSVPAVGMCCIGTLCLLKRRYEVPGVLLFALSLVFKPHLGYMIMFYLLLTKVYRKRALQIIGATIALYVPPLVWVSLQANTKHWYSEYSANLKAIAMRGRLSDPGPTNSDSPNIVDLQSVVSVIKDDRAFYNHVVWAFCLVLLAVWVVLVLRLRDGRSKDLLSLASACAFTLLPFYHRSGDTLLLLLTFPALALLISRSRVWGSAGIVMSLAMAMMVSFLQVRGHTYLVRIPRYLIGSVWDGKLFTILLERQASLACLMACLFYLWVMYKWQKGDFESGPLGTV
jgi:hypothetical protein